MKQHEAVIMALEKMGGQATFADLYRETLKIVNGEPGLPLHLFGALFSSVRKSSKSDLDYGP
jgi:hypothetical protein